MRKNRIISQGLYHWTRQLHLYFGVFISPFILLFAISAIPLNHRWQPNPREHKTSVPVQITEGLEKMELVNSILAQLNLTGEVIGRGQVRNNQTVIRVTRPGKMKILTVDMLNKKAEIVERTFGFLDTLRYLHLNPGPHKLPNWFFTRFWGWMADTTVYVILFLSLSGIYMWAVIKAERKVGLIMLASGCLSFVWIVYALLYA